MDRWLGGMAREYLRIWMFCGCFLVARDWEVGLSEDDGDVGCVQ